MEVVLTTLRTVMDHNTRLENELTRTNQLMNILSTEYASTKELLHSLTKDYTSTKQNAAALTIEHASTKEELAALTFLYTDTKHQLNALTDDHSTFNRILHTTRTDLDKASKELVKVKRALGHEKERNRQSRIIPPTATAVTTSKPVSQSVAFFAVMNDHQQNLGIYQTVGFQKTVTNVGNGWDGQANIFKAPKAGHYYFSATIMSHYAEDIETELVLKGIPIVHSYDGDKSTNGVGTLSAVLNLAIGDDVWIRIYNNPATNDGNVRVYGRGWSCTDIDKARKELIKAKEALAHEKERNRQSRIITPTEIAVTTPKPVPQCVAFFVVMTDHQQNVGLTSNCRIPEGGHKCW
ncbi:C1QL [Mytilus coruscus]|uniref:C1QL n=1 Tax=Mytilus coruscus TaxID=42192 RepID=A0A6J8A9P1_MYTCO|nr:C1QL [Mytilus coruscus]